MKLLLWCIFLTVELSSAKRSSRHHRLHSLPVTTSRAETTTVTSTSTPSSKLINSADNGECEGWWCGPGRECEVSPLDGLPRCKCVSDCRSESNGNGVGKTVCGTDGRFYESHCELHRTACLTQTQLAIDHSNACFKHNRKQNLDKLGERKKSHLKRGHSLNNNNLDVDLEEPLELFSDYKDSKSKNKNLPPAPFPGTGEESSESTLVTGKTDPKNNWSKLFPLPEKKEGSSSDDNEEEDDDADIDDDDDEEEEEDEDDEDNNNLSVEDLVRDAEGPSKSAAATKSGSSARTFSNSRPASNPRRIEEIRRESSSLCSPQEYEILKDNLLLYNHERMIGGVRNFKAAMERGNNNVMGGGGGAGGLNSKVSPLSSSDEEGSTAVGDGPEAGKDYLLSLMFSHFDRNNNGALEYDELHRVDMDESLTKLATGCSLVHLLRFDDSDHNGQLNINEFYTAFNKLYSVSVISLDKALEITHVTATVGDNVEIKCDVSGSPPMPIVWRRYGVDLSSLNQDEQIRVFPDGTLYLNKIQLLHSGNYSCHAQRNQEVIQTHILSVQTLPDVKVMPHIVWEKPGEEVSMECRVMGEPFPVVQWLKNDDPLPIDTSHKYSLTGDGIRLTLKDVYFSDTGAYMCKAQNSAGKKLDISSLVVIDQQTPSTVQMNESQFFVFHDRGISIYDPTNCRIQHQIQGTDIIPGTQQEYVCGDHGASCDWGRAIRVSSTYVYASQPKLDRVLVISTSQMVVVDVVPTDRYPVELHYIPHLDQVWVQCWRAEESPSQKTLQVIREGKEKRKHHTVHPEPIDSHFDLVENLFVPPDTKSSSQFRYAYVSHKNGRGLYKMDLVALRYIKSVDLTPYNCVPSHLEFSALYGMIIVECFEPVTNRPTGQLVLDSLTDSVIYYKGDRFGRPYLSPDSRKLVTVSHGPDGTTLYLQLIRETGLEFSFDVKTSLNVSDVTFFPSQRSHTYDLYASSVDKDDVLFVDLESGKVEMVSGVGSVVGQSSWKSPLRSISAQGLFSKYLATLSEDSVYVLNGHSHTINCQIGGLPKPHLLVWL